MKDTTIRKIKEIVGWLLVLAGCYMLGACLKLCQSNDIWYDELFTMGLTGKSYGELTSLAIRDVHPPLYYYIVRFLTQLCKLISDKYSLVWIAKAVSVLPYFCILAYCLTYIRKHFGILAGGMTFFMCIAMPQLSAYTVEIRMYSCAMLFVMAAMLHAHGIVSGEGRRVGHFIGLYLYGLAAAYTQYFACIAIMMVYFWVIISLSIYKHSQKRKIPESKDKRLYYTFICIALSIVGYLPWLSKFISQVTTVNENYWIQPLTVKSIGGCIKFLFKPAFANFILNVIFAVVLFAVYLLLLVVNCLRLIRKDEADDSYAVNSKIEAGFIIGCFMVLGGLVIMGFILSIAIRPIFVYRYMIPACGCFWLCIALMIEKELDNICAKKEQVNITDRLCQLSQALQIVSAIGVLLVIVMGIRCFSSFRGEELYKIRLMSETEEALNALPEDAVLIYNFDQLQAVGGFYIDRESYLWSGEPEVLIQDICHKYGALNDSSASIRSFIENGRRVYFLGSFNARDEILVKWQQEQGIKASEIGSYMLERYWFNIYELSL